MNNSRPYRIAVYGAGAIGCLLAARLARAGCDVTLIARGQTLAALQQNGVSLTVQGETQTYALRATDQTAQVGPVDYVFLSVKQQALDEIGEQLEPLLRDGGTVVPAVNGIPWWFLPSLNTTLGEPTLRSVDAHGIFKRCVPLDRVLGSVVYVAAHSEAPGVVVQNARNNLVIGELNGATSARATELARLFNASGLQCDISATIHEAVWLKAAGNATFNPLSVLANATMSELVEDPYLSKLARAMLGEYLSLGKALGLSISMTTEQRMAVAASAGPVRTSMLQDALKGKPLEIDALIGSMVEIAEKLGVPMPFTDSVWGLIRHRNRSPGSI